MRTAWLFGLSIFLLFMTTCALAVKIDSLYKGTVPVTTEATAQRTEATRQALEQVMIKVSGNAQILNNPKLKSNLNAADTLIQQFSYSTLPPGSTSPYSLEVQFDPIGVNQWLRDAGPRQPDGLSAERLGRAGRLQPGPAAGRWWRSGQPGSVRGLSLREIAA